MPKLMSKTTFGKIKSMLNDSGITFVEIGNCCDVNSATVSLIARGKHFHQADESEQSRRSGHANAGKPPKAPHYLPTPEDISAACEEIRAGKPEPAQEGWTPPMLAMTDFSEF